jgi:hypothetical protein
MRDLTEAVDAATVDHGQEFSSLSLGHIYRGKVAAVLELAAPVLEAQVRESIAVEIRAERTRVKRGRDGAQVSDPCERGRLYGLSLALSMVTGPPGVALVSS